MSQNSPAARPQSLDESTPRSLADQFARDAPQSDPSSAKYVTELVASLLRSASQAGASDIHFSVGESELQVLWRIDGVLQPIAAYSRSLTPNIVARLKVMAELLTYRTDIPQEGRLRESTSDVEMRLSTFPTLYGEKAVVRLFASSGRFQLPQELGLPEELLEELLGLLHETRGAILITGPAGSGKTTTAYACLRELQREFGVGKSLVTLEDPIETVLGGVSQSPVNRTAGFDYATGLRSLMRQDPDVILVGEIRDRETAETVFQACLTGHLVLSTYHAGNAVEAVSRLGDMGIEPYLLRTGLRAILCQRLLRRLCDCAAWTTEETAKLGFNVARVRIPQGCDQCAGTGYRGRFVIAELLRPDSSIVGRAILDHREADEIQRLAMQQGYQTVGLRAVAAITAGTTSPVEVRRVLGLRRDPETTKSARSDG
ncbi:GspE/PulE family protein [Schlesneria paludicola]|uniref:GspE/PulE family protein n=1 Tax=Schlesneria paludicola TaxID=360056 RepID=UPI00029A740B|nr:GspE/PulE family protein [Schlesneria paludicola]